MKSSYQEVLVFESSNHGRVLVLDGAVQITETDEFVYQEMLTHVPMLAHGNARRVLIIGGGDGGILKRVLQHETVDRAVMVEIDGEVIRLARDYMPGISDQAWDDKRATVIVGDGLAYVADAPDNSFDVIIVDSTDPVGAAESLFTEAFYADCARVVGIGGIVVNQAGVPFMQREELTQTTRRRAAAFEYVTAYVVAVPTYVGGYMALGFSSNTPGLDAISTAEIERRAKIAGILGMTDYWTPQVHSAAFALPPYISRCMESSD